MLKVIILKGGEKDMNYLQRVLSECSPDDALIVRYICDDFGAIDISKSFRLLMRAMLMDADIRANVLKVINQLEKEKEEKLKNS